MQSIYGIQGSALEWYKSSLCQNGECIEVAAQGALVIMRNSTRPENLAYFTAAEFDFFLQAAKMGEFDLV
jgi:hypothetical protein